MNELASLVMARSKTDAVKIVNHARAGAQRAIALFGLATGAVVGASATKVALDLRDTGSKSPDKGNEPSQQGSPGSKDKIDAFDPDATGVKKKGGVKGKLVSLGRRRGWHWLGRTMQVMERYGDLRGNNLAAAVTLQTFLSIFPLVLIASAVLGFVLQNSDSDVAGRIVSASGLKGDAATMLRDALTQAQQSRKASSIIGFLTLIWSALGVTAALQYAYDQAWQTSSRGAKDKAVGLFWLAGAAFLFVASAAVTTAINWLPGPFSVLGIGVGLIVSLALWLFTGKVLPNVNISWRAAIPGAFLGVAGLEILKFLGGVWLPRAVASSSELYGIFGVVLAVLAWLLLFGKLVVYSAVLNVVLYEGKHGVTEATIQMPKPAAEVGTDVTRSGRVDKS